TGGQLLEAVNSDGRNVLIMSWRFRTSFNVMPGIRLNVSRNGLSATLGAAPFSVNVGPQGFYGNVSIPGTGLSYENAWTLPLREYDRSVSRPNRPSYRSRH